MAEEFEVGTAVIPVTANLEPLQEGLGQAKEQLSTFKIAAGSALGAGFVEIVKRGAGALFEFTKQGRRDLEQMSRSLETIERNARRFGNATMDVKKQVEDYATAIQATTRFQDQEVVDSLNTMLRYTRDLGQAQYMLNLAMDVAVGTGQSLEGVVAMLGRAAMGDDRSLRMLGRTLGYTKEQMSSASTAVSQLEKDFGGLAKQEQNAAMHSKRFGDQMGELAEDLAKKVQPAWDGFLIMMTDLTQQLRGALGDEASSIANEIRVAQRGLAGARRNADTAGSMTAYLGAMKNVNYWQGLLNRALEKQKALQADTNAEIDKSGDKLKNKLRLLKEQEETEESIKENMKFVDDLIEQATVKEQKRADQEKANLEEANRLLAEKDQALRNVAGTMASVQANEMQTFFTSLKEGTATAQQGLEAMGRGFLKGMVSALGDVLIQKGAAYNFEALAALVSGVGAAAAPGLFSAGALLTGAGGGMKAVAAGLKEGGVTIAGSTTTDTIPAMLRKNEAVVPLDDPRAQRKLGALGGLQVGSFQVVLPNVRDSKGFSSQSTALTMLKQLQRVQARTGRTFATA